MIHETGFDDTFYYLGNDKIGHIVPGDMLMRTDRHSSIILTVFSNSLPSKNLIQNIDNIIWF